MDEEVFPFFAWREATFCFEQVTWQRLLTFAVDGISLQHRDNFVAAWNVGLSQIMEFIAAKI